LSVATAATVAHQHAYRPHPDRPGGRRRLAVHLIQYRQAMAAVRLPAGAPTPDWATGLPFASVSSSADETSVICPTVSLPDTLPGPVEGPFTVVRVAGTLEISQIGILLRLLKPLADAGIPVLTVSTFDTDWVLVPAAKSAAAASVWRHAGYTVTEDVNAHADPDGGRIEGTRTQGTRLKGMT
jgi:hypothetical protein